MRRSFKDHIRGFCNLKGYDWSDSEDDGRWMLRVDHYIKIFDDAHQKNTYVLVDNINGIRCACKASAWDIMTSVLEELMTEHLNKRAKYVLTVDK